MIYLLLIIVLCFLYFSYRYAWWAVSVDLMQPRILMYHMISDHKKNAKFNGLRVPPEEFEKQIAFLVNCGWHFFTMTELVNTAQLPKKSVAITFDDGYEDNFINALPILKKYNAKATIYLVVDRHDREWSSKRKKKNNTGELAKEKKLSNLQVHELIDSGLIEIGSHTMTHDNLPNLNTDQKLHEISASKDSIEQDFGIQSLAFCYPFGLYDEDDVTLVKSSGYTSATTTKKGMQLLSKDNVFELKRITISGKDNFLAFKIKMKRGLRGFKK